MLKRNALNVDIYVAARKMKGSRSRQRNNPLLGNILAGAAAGGWVEGGGGRGADTIHSVF